MMKRIAFVSIFAFMLSDAMSQSLFKVVEIPRSQLYKKHSDVSTDKYFQIVLNSNIVSEGVLYPFVFPKNFDTVKAISDLLSFEGDGRKCALPIINYNPARSQIYMDAEKNYSVQVEALFLINQLVYKRPFAYSSYPVLFSKKNSKKYSLTGSGVSEAFKAYRIWYQKLKALGLDSITAKEIMPLDKASVRWY